MLVNTGHEMVFSKKRLLTTVAISLQDRLDYALEGSVFIAGAAIKWFKENLHLIKTAQEIDSLAMSVESSEGVVFVPALTGLGAPHWDPLARGMILGLTRSTNANHIARALLEAIAFQTYDVLCAMSSDQLPLKELRVDGGVAQSAFLLQFQADLLQIPILKPKILEITALGAAYLAGLSVGFWSSLDQIQKQWMEDERYEPQKSLKQMQPLIDRWHRAIEVARSYHDV